MLTTDTPLAAIPFAVVDVETTGLEASDRIIEVACVCVRDFQETASLVSLVNPEQPIPTQSTAISGIDSPMVASAPIFAEIAGSLDRLLEGSVFVAHNASFDLHFLSREHKRCSLPPWKGPVLDTLRLARNTLLAPSYSLGALREQLHLAPAPAHRALADVRTTIALLEALVARHEPALGTLGELLRAQEPVSMAWEDLSDATLAPHVAAALRAAGPTGHSLEIVYAGRSGERRYRIIPVQLEHNGPLIYLQAQLAESSGPRTFRVDRIREATLCATGGEARA